MPRANLKSNGRVRVPGRVMCRTGPLQPGGFLVTPAATPDTDPRE
jgi:hypothetical protein